MKKVLIILVVGVGLTFGGCAGMSSRHISSPAKPGANFTLAKSLLEQVFSGYKNYTREEFEKLLSLDFVPLRPEFLNAVKDSYYAGTILEIDFFIDQVLAKADNLSVTFKWEKKTVPHDTPVATLSRGKAEFLFKNKNNQWLLYGVKGNIPF